MEFPMSQVLVIACGALKNETGGEKVRAIDLYAGRQFDLARRLYDLGWEVLILSAEHGFIPADHRIATYDRRMDMARAAAFIDDDFQACIFDTWTRDADRVVFYGGEAYLRVWEGMVERLGLGVIARDCDCEHIIGAGCGDHFSVLKDVVAEVAINP
jgi:hypothetical protein